MSENGQKLYFNLGMPTGPDVKKLEEAFPDLKPGQEIGYEMIEGLIGLQHVSSRFSAVFGAWRRQVFRQRQLRLLRITGKGVEVLTNQAWTEHLAKRKTLRDKHVRRDAAEAQLIRTDDLSDPGKRQLDSLRDALASDMVSTIASSKKLALAFSPKNALPKRV